MIVDVSTRARRSFFSSESESESESKPKRECWFDWEERTELTGVIIGYPIVVAAFVPLALEKVYTGVQSREREGHPDGDTGAHQIAPHRSHDQQPSDQRYTHRFNRLQLAFFKSKQIINLNINVNSMTTIFKSRDRS